MADCPATQTVWKIIPHFHSTSIQFTVDFYSHKLHFKVSSPQHFPANSAEPTFCSVAMGPHAEANIYFFLKKDPIPSSAMIAMNADGLEAYYKQLKNEGMTFKEDIANKEWGYRQFEITDPDGNRLQFFRFLES
jgi:uncharacterized glyoxalase superfamily protein PhnB